MKILKIVIICLLVAGVLGGGVVGLIKLTDDDAFDRKNISSLAFSVGGLDGTGAYMDTNASIYTKDAFECQGLNITLDFDNMIEYKVYFYDQNNDFVHTTGTRTNAFVDTEVPFFAKFARIVVTPTEDDVVSTLEVNKYAKQINVSVNREQGYKNYSEDIFVAGSKGLILSDSPLDGFTTITDESTSRAISGFIDVSSYKECVTVVLQDEFPSEHSVICVYSSLTSFTEAVDMDEFIVLDKTYSNGYRYVSFRIPEGAKYLRFTYYTTDVPKLYAR